MRIDRLFRRGAACLLIALAGVPGQPDHASAQEPPADAALSPDVFVVQDKHTTLEISERFSKVLQFNSRVSRVDGFDPSVLAVTALSPTQIRVQALAQGVTTLVVTDETNAVFSVEVLVSGDARQLQAVLHRNFPTTSVKATKIKDSVLLRGWVTNPDQIPQIIEISELYFPRVLNQMQVGGPQQVQLRVKVMEVQRSKLRKFGFNFIFANDSGYFQSTPGAINPINTVLLPLGGTPGVLTGLTTGNGIQLANAAKPALSFGVTNGSGAFQGLIDALRQEGLLKIQAEPTLVTRNGQPAKLLNGGEFPILVPQSLGTVTIDWREFGVRLESVPIILGQNRVQQMLIAEVSERDFTSAVSIQGTTVPGLTKRRVETSVDMQFGQTLVIGGLISVRRTGQQDKIPFLGELPFVGAAFRRTSYSEVETELLVLVTPEYVAPFDPCQVPTGGPGLGTTIPTDHELLDQGVLEVPNYGGADCPPFGPGACPTGPCPPGLTAPPLGGAVPPAPGMILPGPLPPGAPMTPDVNAPLIGPPGTPMLPHTAPAISDEQAAKSRAGAAQRQAAGRAVVNANPPASKSGIRTAAGTLESQPGLIEPASATKPVSRKR